LGLIRHETSEASLRRERILATISRSSRVSWTLTILVTQSRASLRNCDFEAPAERPNISAVSLRSYLW